MIASKLQEKIHNLKFGSSFQAAIEHAVTVGYTYKSTGYVLHPQAHCGIGVGILAPTGTSKSYEACCVAAYIAHYQGLPVVLMTDRVSNVNDMYHQVHEHALAIGLDEDAILRIESVPDALRRFLFDLSIEKLSTSFHQMMEGLREAFGEDNLSSSSWNYLRALEKEKQPLTYFNELIIKNSDDDDRTSKAYQISRFLLTKASNLFSDYNRCNEDSVKTLSDEVRWVSVIERILFPLRLLPNGKNESGVKILFLTTKKSQFGVSGLDGKTALLDHTLSFPGAVWFIDEFDAQASELDNHYLTQNTPDDLLTTPAKLSKIATSVMEGATYFKDISKLRAELLVEAEKMDEVFALNRHVINEIPSFIKGSVFSDRKGNPYAYFTNSQNKHKSKYCDLVFIAEKQDDGDVIWKLVVREDYMEEVVELSLLISSLTQYSKNAITKIANYCVKVANELHNIAPHQRIFEAVRMTLYRLSLANDDKGLVTAVMNHRNYAEFRSRVFNQLPLSSLLQRSVYSTGTSVTQVKPVFSDGLELETSSIDRSGEAWIAGLLSRGVTIVGLSATIRNPSILGNFNYPIIDAMAGFSEGEQAFIFPQDDEAIVEVHRNTRPFFREEMVNARILCHTKVDSDGRERFDTIAAAKEAFQIQLAKIGNSMGLGVLPYSIKEKGSMNAEPTQEMLRRVMLDNHSSDNVILFMNASASNFFNKAHAPLTDYLFRLGEPRAYSDAERSLASRFLSVFHSLPETPVSMGSMEAELKAEDICLTFFRDRKVRRRVFANYQIKDSKVALVMNDVLILSEEAGHTRHPDDIDLHHVISDYDLSCCEDESALKIDNPSHGLKKELQACFGEIKSLLGCGLWVNGRQITRFDDECDFTVGMPVKMMIMTNYIASEKGLNITRPLLRGEFESGDVIKISDTIYNERVDLDVLFLSKPSHVMSTLLNSPDATSELKTQIFYLATKLLENNEISPNIHRRILDALSTARESGEINRKILPLIKETMGIRHLLMKMLLQTYGRVLRSNLRKSLTNILIADDFRKALHGTSIAPYVIVSETRPVIDALGLFEPQDAGLLTDKLRAKHRAARKFQFCQYKSDASIFSDWSGRKRAIKIDRAIRAFFSDYLTFDNWSILEDYIATFLEPYPLDIQDELFTILCDLFWEFDEPLPYGAYAYSGSVDSTSLESVFPIRMNEKGQLTQIGGYVTVSNFAFPAMAAAASEKVLFSLNPVPPASKVVPSPIAFINYIKAQVGENLIRHLINTSEETIGIRFLPMQEDDYELMDGVLELESGGACYVDFKNLSESTQDMAEAYHAMRLSTTVIKKINKLSHPPKMPRTLLINLSGTGYSTRYALPKLPEDKIISRNDYQESRDFYVALNAEFEEKLPLAVLKTARETCKLNSPSQSEIARMRRLKGGALATITDMMALSAVLIPKKGGTQFEINKKNLLRIKSFINRGFEFETIYNNCVEKR